MPKLTLDDIIKGRKQLQKDAEELEKNAKALQTKINKGMMEYRTIAEGLDEGSKHIEELKRELTAAYDTWQAMFTKKLPQIKTRVGDVADDVKKARVPIKAIETDASELIAGLAKCAGDVADMKAENDALKGLVRISGRLNNDYDLISDQATQLPKDPKDPTLKL